MSQSHPIMNTCVNIWLRNIFLLANLTSAFTVELELCIFAILILLYFNIKLVNINSLVVKTMDS